MAVSKSKAASASKAKAAPKADAECCAKCEADIKSLEKKIESLESKLAGLLEGIETASKLKAELDEAKLKLGSEVNELKENAKSWVTKTKEAVDSNKDGKIDFEEVYSYIWGRQHSRHPKPRK